MKQSSSRSITALYQAAKRMISLCVCLKSDFNGMSFVNVNSEHLLSNRASNEPLLCSFSSSFRITRLLHTCTVSS